MVPFHCFINVLNIFKDYIARLLAQPFIYSAELSSAYVSPPSLCLSLNSFVCYVMSFSHRQ